MARSRKISKTSHVLKPPLHSPGLKHRIDYILASSKGHNIQRRTENSLPTGRSDHAPLGPPRYQPEKDAEIFLKSALDKFNFAINNSYSKSTSTNHSYAIKRFLRFAAKCGLAEEDALPCDPTMLCMWIADGVGRTGVGTATANIAALSAWHRGRGLPFNVPLQVQTIKRALKLHWPEEKQQKPPRPPISPRMIRLLAESWSKGTPRQLCALAIALAAFIGQMRLGELVPASAKDFIREHLPSRARWSLRDDSSHTSSIFLPWTKTTGKAGALVTLPIQSSPMDPTRAICLHLIASALDDRALLCEYIEGRKVVVLDKEEFMAMCNNVWSQHGFQRITGHSFRIGGTTSLLLSGVDAEIVKGMGRWSSDAFKLYWRKVEILFAKHASDVNWVDFEI